MTTTETATAAYMRLLRTALPICLLTCHMTTSDEANYCTSSVALRPPPSPPGPFRAGTGRPPGGRRMAFGRRSFCESPVCLSYSQVRLVLTEGQAFVDSELGQGTDEVVTANQAITDPLSTRPVGDFPHPLLTEREASGCRRDMVSGRAYLRKD